jgi:hypothetical protein
MLKESFAFVILRERSDRRIWAQDKLREEFGDPSLSLRVTNFILFFHYISKMLSAPMLAVQILTSQAVPGLSILYTKLFAYRWVLPCSHSCGPSGHIGPRSPPGPIGPILGTSGLAFIQALYSSACFWVHEP